MNVRGVLSIGVRRVGAALSLVMRALFGSVAWQPPRWLSFLRARSLSLGSWARSHPRLAAMRTLLVLVVIGAAFGGTWWYRHRPKPVEIALHAVAPELTKLEQEKWKVFPMVVVFDGSVAPLDKVGKTVAPGPVLSPSLDGVWNWDDDHHLSFQPKADRSVLHDHHSEEGSRRQSHPIGGI